MWISAVYAFQDGQKGVVYRLSLIHIFAQTLQKLGTFHLSVSYPGHWDICNPNAGKEIAAQRLARKFGIDRQNIMAIGDSSNDIGMLRWAGLGVAMGNAVPEVKAAADVITGSCEEGGFAQALRQYVL